MKIYDKIEKYIWLLIICSFIYFILPLSFIALFPKQSGFITIVSVLFVNVMFSFVMGIISSKRHGFNYAYPIILGIYFIPFCLMVYTSSTLMYSLLYIVVCYVSSLIYYKYKK